MTIELEHRLNPKQEQLVYSEHRYTWMWGGWGAGKTIAIVYRILWHMIAFGQVDVLYCMFTHKMIDDIFMPKLRSILGIMFPGGDGNRYHINDHKHDVYIIPDGGRYADRTTWSKLLLRSLDDPDKITGFEVSHAYVDEAQKGLDHQSMLMIQGRMRSTERESLQTFTGVLNPKLSKTSWLYQNHLKQFIEGTPRRDCLGIHTTTYDNEEHLSQAYLDDLKKLPKNIYDIMVLGKFGVLEGLVYSAFDMERHLHDFQVDPSWTFYRGIDFGWTDPFCCIWAGRDEKGRLFFFDEYYLAETQIEAHADAILERQEREHFPRHFHTTTTFYDRYDRPDHRVILEQRLEGMFEAGKNDLEDGPQEIIKSMVKSEDGIEYFNVHPRCQNLTIQLGSIPWQRKELKERVVYQIRKKDDHAENPIRYIHNSVENYSGDSITLASVPYPSFTQR